MKITVLTLFPSWFDGPFGESILGRARERGWLELRTVNFRDWAADKHQSVDDAPFGGGGGMILRPGPLCAALDGVAGSPGAPHRAHVILTSPRGRTWNQERAKELAGAGKDVVIVCGRYEGVDERVIESRVDEEVSLGDFVITGGEIAALAVVDSVARMIPGVLGNDSSAPNDSFYDGLLEGPHYTRPEEFEGRRVPEVLLSGNHAAIRQWRHEQAVCETRKRRPDLYEIWAAAQPPPKPKRNRRKRANNSGLAGNTGTGDTVE